jgi:hypothetical protein
MGWGARSPRLPGQKAWDRGHGRLESRLAWRLAMLKKLDRPVVWVILCNCFFASFGFAVGEAVQRVNDAVALNPLYQHKNILERVGEYFDSRVTLFTLVFVTVAMFEAGFFFYQLRLKRQIVRATVKANATAREVANETRALLARLNEFDLERELWVSIRDEIKKAS